MNSSNPLRYILQNRALDCNACDRCCFQCDLVCPLFIPGKSTFVGRWDVAVVVALLYTAAITPFEVAFLDSDLEMSTGRFIVFVDIEYLVVVIPITSSRNSV